MDDQVVYVIRDEIEFEIAADEMASFSISIPESCMTPCSWTDGEIEAIVLWSHKSQ